jgi:hypothetical protein
MKKNTTLLLKAKVIVCIIALSTFTFHVLKSQTFPFSEDFDLVPDTTLPSGWAKNYNAYTFINVYSNEGVNNSKAAMLRLYSTYTMADTLFSPVIGPVTANASLSIKYKFIQAPASSLATTGPYAAGSFNWPFFWYTNTNSVFFPNFKIVVINTANNAETTILQTDSTNYISSMSYVLQTPSLSNFSGQNIKIAFILNGLCENYFSEFWIDDIIIDDSLLSTNIKEMKEIQKETTNVFPNPTQDELTIISEEAVTVTVYDIVGRVVYKENVSEPKHTIHLSENPTGIYTVSVYGANINRKYHIAKK